MNQKFVFEKTPIINKFMGYEETRGIHPFIFATDYNAIMPVVEKIEKELGYFMVCLPFLSNETGEDGTETVGDTYWCVFNYKDSRPTSYEAYVDVNECSTRLEAIFQGVVAFLEKYYSEKEKVAIKTAIEAIEAKRKLDYLCEIKHYLHELWEILNIDYPKNEQDVIDYIYNVLNENGQIVYAPNTANISNAFKCWIETR